MTLDARLRRDGSLPLEAALSITARILEALQHAHGMGVLHHDIKPANILITPEGMVEVTGFGAERLTRTGRIIGRLDYMAPERILGKDADARADLYAVGVLLFEMLTGRRPFVADNQLLRMRQQMEASTQIPEGLERILQIAMARQPGQRFSSAGEFLTALQPYLAPVPQQLLPVPRAKIGMLLLAMAVGLLAIVFWLRTSIPSLNAKSPLSSEPKSEDNRTRERIGPLDRGGG